MITQKAQKLLIGAHTSAAGGAYNALIEGASIGATTIQLFTANQRRWDAKALTPESVTLWKEALAKTGLESIMSHDSYLINLGSPDPEGLKKSRHAFREELIRCHQLNLSFLNFHPGAALEGDIEACLDRIADSLFSLEDLCQDGTTMLLLENTAGQGSSVGHRFEQIGYVLKKIKKHVPVGVCLDTCHLFAAGYDIRTPQAWEETLTNFDEEIGLSHLKAFHLNDSVKGLGTKIDRHASLGKGLIGLECFKFLMNDPRTQNIPKYLETPEGPPIWKQEIQMLREMVQT